MCAEKDLFISKEKKLNVAYLEILFIVAFIIL